MTDYVNVDDYEDMAATFQVMMLHWLNSALQRAGIASKDLCRNICEDFGFNFGAWKDQYWFRDSFGNTVFPCVAFATAGPVVDKSKTDLGTVFLPSPMFSFAEYLHGNIHHYFDEIVEEPSGIATGPSGPTS